MLLEKRAVGGESTAVTFAVSFLCLLVRRRLNFSWALTQEREKVLSYSWSSPLCVSSYLLLVAVRPDFGASFHEEEERGYSSVRLDPGIISSLIILQYKNLNFHLILFNMHFYLISI